jgi:hypothetical protein
LLRHFGSPPDHQHYHGRSASAMPVVRRSSNLMNRVQAGFPGPLTDCGFDTFRISTAKPESIPHLSDWDHRPISGH